MVVGVEGEIVEVGHGTNRTAARPSRVASGPCSIADIADACALDWSFVAEGRAQMAATGACEIPAFVRAEALPAFIDDARRLAPLAHRSGGLGTVYLGFPDESFPPDHPQQWLGQYDVGAVAYDLFPRRLADPPAVRVAGAARASSPRSSGSTRSSRTPIRSARSTSR